MRWLGILALTACRFGFDPVDVASILPTHVAAAPEPVGSLAFDLDALIDTSALTIDGQLPPETVVFTAVPQIGGGPDLALLVVTDFEIGDAQVRVIGERPLVIAASSIAIAGLLDGSARLSLPGPGGSLPARGDGAGQVALNTLPDDVCDAAGGGAGFESPGGKVF